MLPNINEVRLIDAPKKTHTFHTSLMIKEKLSDKNTSLDLQAKA